MWTLIQKKYIFSEKGWYYKFMQKVHFNGFIIYYHRKMNVYMNDDKKRLIFISESNGEIHGLIELEKKKIKIHPRWNVLL